MHKCILWALLCLCKQWYVNLRDHFVYVPSQWEMLHCNGISHCLGANTKWYPELTVIDNKEFLVCSMACLPGVLCKCSNWTPQNELWCNSCWQHPLNHLVHELIRYPICSWGCVCSGTHWSTVHLLQLIVLNRHTLVLSWILINIVPWNNQAIFFYIMNFKFSVCWVVFNGNHM